MREVTIYQLARVIAKRRKIYKDKAKSLMERYRKATDPDDKEDYSNRCDNALFGATAMEWLWSDIKFLGEQE